MFFNNGERDGIKVVYYKPYITRFKCIFCRKDFLSDREGKKKKCGWACKSTQKVHYAVKAERWQNSHHSNASMCKSQLSGRRLSLALDLVFSASGHFLLSCSPRLEIDHAKSALTGKCSKNALERAKRKFFLNHGHRLKKLL